MQTGPCSTENTALGNAEGSGSDSLSRRISRRRWLRLFRVGRHARRRYIFAGVRRSNGPGGRDAKGTAKGSNEHAYPRHSYFLEHKPPLHAATGPFHLTRYDRYVIVPLPRAPLLSSPISSLPQPAIRRNGGSLFLDEQLSLPPRNFAARPMILVTFVPSSSWFRSR